MSDPVEEYAVRMTDGGMHVRNPHPDIERIYPLRKWIEGQIRIDRAHVYRRTITVVEDWVEVTLPAADELPSLNARRAVHPQ